MANIQLDNDFLQAALVGYQKQHEELQQVIAALRKQLGDRAVAGKVSTGPIKSTRKPMSAAARKRIAAAQRKRWKAYRKKHRTA